jgi:hypothetical protein
VGFATSTADGYGMQIQWYAPTDHVFNLFVVADEDQMAEDFVRTKFAEYDTLELMMESYVVGFHYQSRKGVS